tara:strand:+ start:72509 stop:73354 length:846 start_codon:yes stop_codon:yes gene_type:complete
VNQYPTVDDRFKALPKSLQAKSTHTRLGIDVPALIVHPQLDQPTQSPCPWVLWIHGRSVYKELDPGRYNRWVRAGIGAVAIDLPGHGERYTEAAQSPDQTVHTLTQCISEIDGILESIADLGIFDMTKAAMGGMSAGGMVTSRRCCDPHPFIGISLECTTGDLLELYFPTNPTPRGIWRVHHDRSEVEAIDTPTHLEHFKPIPVLAMHNRGDELVPFDIQSNFINTLRKHYTQHNADPNTVQLVEFEDTGAIQEHAGFGKFATQAKDQQLQFFKSLFGIES